MSIAAFTQNEHDGIALDQRRRFGVCDVQTLNEAWVSASFGVRKRSVSLSGLDPDMLMDWTCTM
ncbi:hypothetical protein EYF80_011006 [Liparis tanakae]|uniref:Uncharacterized protein n=1 Tax=Liparis tanakae TaxID=230148 RepID=A0A4Z2ILR0_9TELE|nr:hypothetical protein EYF80_011006 [Liparis tanakae]